ncbi:MAG: Ig-like domain-containing protein [Candidatus Pacebacteria bacterium]|nr:Ig-like domain-containing protein [Candidatus Paceibacterota bacterium]
MNNNIKKISLYAFSIIAILFVSITYAQKPSFEVVPQSAPTVTNIIVNPDPQNIGKNILITAKIVDVSGISSAKAQIEDLFGTVILTMDLYDNGTNFDVTAADDIFSNSYNISIGIPVGNYKVFIIASDVLGNVSNTEQAGFSIIDAVRYLATIDIAPVDPSVGEGGTQNFTVTLKDQFGDPYAAAVTWSSSDVAVGTINAAGLFSALSAGATIITASNGLVSKTTFVTVSALPYLAAINIVPVNPSIAEGLTQNFTATPVDQYGNLFASPITWSSSNNVIGTISAVGLFNALSGGVTNITATSGAVSKTSVVTVIGTPYLATIDILPFNPNIAEGTTQAFTATPKDQYGDAFVAPITWTSSDIVAGTIDGAGLFSAWKFGTTTVTATSGAVSGTSIVAVTAGPPYLYVIDVTPVDPTVAIGVIQPFTATPKDQNGVVFPSTITWSSSDNTVGTIDEFGAVTALVAGTTTVTATSGAVSGTSLFTVAGAPYLATIDIIPVNPSIVEGSTQAFTAFPKDQFGVAFASTITWSSSDNTVGTIDAAGDFTAILAGITTVTAASGAVSGTSMVTVTAGPPYLATIDITPLDPEIAPGLTQAFIAFPKDQNGVDFPVPIAWSSDDNAVGTIDAVGLFTALADGATVITATSGAVNGTSVAFVVGPYLDSIVVNLINPGVTIGSTLTFTVTATDQYGDPFLAAVTWSSNNNAVGTINAGSGVFLAIADGIVEITATSGLETGTTDVYVTAVPFLNSIDIIPVNPEIIIGGTQIFAGAPKDQYGVPFPAIVVWSSSDGVVGTIDASGFFTALTSGTTTITATSGAKSGTTTANVESVSVLIQSPLDGDNYTRGDLIDFKGSILNAVPDYSYEWTSNIDGLLSTEKNFSTLNLSANNHTITLEVTDGITNIYTKSIDIVVNSPATLTIQMQVSETEYFKDISYFFGTSVTSGGTGEYLYNWHLESGPPISTNKIAIVEDIPWSLGYHTLTVEVTDGVDTAQDTMIINVVENTSIYDVYPKDGTIFVLGQPIAFNAVEVVTYGFGSISWKSDGILIGNTMFFQKSDLAVGLHNIEVRIRDSSFPATPEVVKTFRIEIIPVPTDCDEDWICTDWSGCVVTTRTRTCSDNNFCGTSVLKPAEIDNSCAVPPVSFDWRDVSGINYMTGVRDQGLCQSSWAFSTLGATESKYKIQTGNIRNLSEQDLASCSYAGNCIGGTYKLALNYLEDSGITDEAHFPYQSATGLDVPCFGKSVGWENNIWKINGSYKSAAPAQQTIKDRLVNDGPVITSMNLNDELYGGWSFTTKSCDDDDYLNQDVVIVGYDDVSGYWIVKNSWGLGWNAGGYFKVNFGECGIEKGIGQPKEVINP